MESHINDYEPKGPQGAPNPVKREKKKKKKSSEKKKRERETRERERESLIVPSSSRLWKKGLNLKTVEDLVQGYGTIQRKRPMVGSRHLTRLFARTRMTQLC